MPKKKCQLCLMECTNFAKSHIIPKWAYPYAMPKNDATHIQKGSFPKRKPAGEYDSHILCHNCEKKFNKPDSYGCDVLRDTPTSVMPSANDEVLLLQIDNHSLFLMSILSMLWRMHVSKVFPGVNLGTKHAEKIRKALLAEEPLSETDYPLILARLSRDLGPSSIVTSAIKGKMFVENINLCYQQFIIGDYAIMAFMDSQSRQAQSPAFTYIQQPNVTVGQAKLSELGLVKSMAHIFEQCPKINSTMKKQLESRSRQ